MRALIIVLAIVGGIFVVTIGGCVACVAVVASAFSGVEHFNRSQIEETYSQQLSEVREALNAGSLEAYPATQFDDAVVAVFELREREVGSDDYHDLYRRHSLSKHGHSLWNHVGTFNLSVDNQRGAFAGYGMRVGDQQYYVILRDWLDGNDPSPAP